jgi:pyruvate,water dikinase
MQPIYHQARRYRLYREAVSFTYTYGYGLFRIFFLALGERLQQRALLASAEDIFYLSWEEVQALAAQPSAWQAELPALELTRSRREDMQNCADLHLPEVIYGDQLPPLETPDRESHTLTGIPSSRGYYRGAVRVIRQAADFDKLQRGEVLVIPYSDVGWTPLFTRAGAVVAEAGGMLSHSSIVAREYNLPCVVSVSGACRLPDGIEVSVDGYKGAVYIHANGVEVII